MDLDERAVKIFEEAEALSKNDLRGALAKMREALALEPEYPQLEDEIFIREDAIAKLDGILEFIVVLLREGKDYQACEMLQELPDNYVIQDKSGLVAGLIEKITRAQKLVEQARELAKTDYAKALPLFEEAFELVPDYPELGPEITALRKNVSQYDAFIASIEKAIKNKDADTATDFFVNFKTVYPDDANVKRFKVAIINLSKELKKKKHEKVNFLKIAAVIVVVLVAAASYFAYEMVMIKKAGHQWEEVARLLAAQKFTESQAACADINRQLGRVHLFFLSTKQELQGKIDGVLNSEVVVKGAEGKVLFDGDYIPKEQLAESREVKEHIEAARAFAAGRNYEEAIRKFEDALAAVAALKKEPSAEVVNDIKLSITRSRLNMVQDIAGKAGALLATGSYAAALNEINRAVAMVAEYSLDAANPLVGKTYAVRRQILLAQLKGLIAAADKLFMGGSYDNAIKGYERATVFARNNDLAADPSARQIVGMINKSRINGVISRGDRYLAAAKWPEAVAAYEKGVALALEHNLKTLPSVQRAQLNLKKAEKMEMVAELARQNDLARQYLGENKGKKAREVFVRTIKAAEGRGWLEDSDVGAILAELRSGLAEAEEKIFIDDKKKFLYDRYGAILKKDFGLGGSATLLDPEILLLAATPEFLKFRVSAISYTKKGSTGKYSRYEVVYVLARKTERWELVDKSSDSKVTADRGYN